MLVLCVLSRPLRRLVRDALVLWPVWVPAAAGLGLFTLLGVYLRYIGHFLAMVMVVAVSIVRVPPAHRAARAQAALIIVLFISLAKSVVGSAILPDPMSDVARINIEVARALEEVGLRRGDRVALLRAGGGVYWARLSGVQVVAEITQPDAYWRAGAAERRNAIAALAGTGASMIVTSALPRDADASGWTRLGDTSWYVYLLRR
jgi:hypothetical protein